MGLQIRQRRAMQFVERVDATRLAYASVQDKEAMRAYQRLRRELLSEAGISDEDQRLLTPHEVAQQQAQLEFPLPGLFAKAPAEFWQHVRVKQRGSGS